MVFVACHAMREAGKLKKDDKENAEARTPASSTQFCGETRCGGL